MKKTTVILLAMILVVSLYLCSASAEGTDGTPFFAKEKGFFFVEPHEYAEMPTTTAMKAENLDYTARGTCRVTAPVISLRRPDENGNVTYTIQYTVNPTYTVQYAASKYVPDWDFETWTEEFHPFDYYTGLSFFPKNDEMNREVTIPYKGEDIIVKLSRDYGDKWLPYKNDSSFTVFDQEGVFDVRMEITAPAEYDGLVLGIQCGEPVSEQKYDVARGEWDADLGETWDDAENLDNWEFIRVKDFAAFESLKSGNYGANVRELQQQLKDLGYLSGGVDGDFGPGTAKAVSAFQTAAGLEETGIADDATQRALYGLSAPGEAEEESAVSEAPEQTEAPAQESHPEEAAQESQPTEPENKAVPDPTEATVNVAAESAELAEETSDSGPVQEELAAEEAETSVEPGQENMGPYGIPLYNSADEVDLATIFAGLGRKRIIDLFGGFEIVTDQKEFNLNGDMVFYAVNHTYGFIDNEYWDEPLYVSFGGSDPQFSSGYDYVSSRDLFVYNIDFYHGNPYSICFGPSGYGDKSYVKPDDVEKRLVRPIWNFNESLKYSVTGTEELNGMYLVNFDVLDGDTVKYKDCYVLIDPKTSLICEYSYHYDSTFMGIPTINEITQKIHFGLEELPDYYQYMSKIG